MQILALSFKVITRNESNGKPTTSKFKNSKLNRITQPKKDLKRKLTKASKSNDPRNKKKYEIKIKYLNGIQNKTILKNTKQNTSLKIKELTEGNVDRNKIFKFRKKLFNYREDHATAILNQQGKEVTDDKEIKEANLRYFKALLQNRKPKSGFKRIYKRHNKIFKAILKKTLRKHHKNDRDFTMKELEIAIKSSKKRKCQDPHGLVYEVLIEGGFDLKKSILLMMNSSHKMSVFPKSWYTLVIKTIFKNKGSFKDLSNWRGIFITSIFYKLYEKLIYNREEKKIDHHFSEFAAGARKHRSTTDHLFTIQAIIDYYRYLKKSVHLLFLDLEKAFDKLWLTDTLIDIYKSGVSGKSLKNLYKLNKKSIIVIRTPCGDTKQAKIGKNVKQGTIWGAPLCANTIDQITPIMKEENLGINLGKLKIHPLLYQDDILACSVTSNMLKQQTERLETFQNEKLMKFGDSKTKIVTVRNNKSKRQSLDISLNNTRIETVDTYKYLSMYMNKQGSLTETIERRKAPLKKLSFELSSLLKRSSYDKKQFFENGILLYNSIVKSILLYAGETWTNITKTQCNKLEQIQAKTLKTILGLEKSTPNIGLLNELGILPIELQLKKMRLMFLHKISSLPNSRLVKQVFNEQRRIGFPNCWWEEVKQDLVGLNLPTSTDDITESSKSLWGKEIDKRLISEFNGKVNDLRKKLSCNNKLRYLTHFTGKLKSYLKGKHSGDILRTKLCMQKIKNNFKGIFENITCRACGLGPESYEHIIKQNTKKSIIDHIYSDNYERLVKYEKEILKFVNKGLSKSIL